MVEVLTRIYFNIEGQTARGQGDTSPSQEMPVCI
jgi:hypothetical protein